MCIAVRSDAGRQATSYLHVKALMSSHVRIVTPTAVCIGVDREAPRHWVINI